MMRDAAQIYLDQHGHPWLVLPHKSRISELWALGYDEDGLPAMRQILNGEIVTSYVNATAVRKLTSHNLKGPGP